MRKFILLLLFINLNIVAYNQTITGTVFDKDTHETICSAAIYFNGTFVGTASDMNGFFVLDISKNALMPVTISAVGYYSLTLTDFSTDKPLVIYLKPKLYELEEVVVSTKLLPNKRKANLTLFKKIFLGTTTNAKNCEITNEKDITFNKSDEDTLKAFANQPIHIYNKELGYKITYYLDKFEFNKKRNIFLFAGNIIFNEDLATKGSKRRLYERKRKDAFQGSRMHFFRSLWANQLASNGFKVYDSFLNRLSYMNLVIQEDTPSEKLSDPLKYLKYFPILRIYYTKLSTITLLKEKVYFDKDGFSDQLAISWEGEMVMKRIGDMLPYEYYFKK
ncbi:MAG: carboxypeptidase-like regulatory domain-containing protein [Bacteroidia bacterium]|nr:carboxypeptidase-like regulatory domain-containing protein [Bacteroidia bacterium]